MSSQYLILVSVLKKLEDKDDNDKLINKIK